MNMEPNSTQGFASLRTPIFTDTVSIQLINCLQGLMEAILVDENGTVCRKVETEVSETARYRRLIRSLMRRVEARDRQLGRNQMATISDPTQHDPLPGQDTVWGARAVDGEGPNLPRSREPSRLELLRPPFGAREADPPPPVAIHCSIVVVDIEGFGDLSRNNSNQVRTRRGLYNALRHSFDTAGIPWDRCQREDRGDGVLILAPADIPKALFVDRLPGTLAEALAAHNKRHPASEQIRLRLALHAGEIFHDEHGVTSSSINHTFRILEARAIKVAFAESTGILAVIGSSWFFEEVIRQSDWSEAHAYTAVDVVNKETETRAWIRTVGRSRAKRRKPNTLQRLTPRR